MQACTSVTLMHTFSLSVLLQCAPSARRNLAIPNNDKPYEQNTALTETTDLRNNNEKHALHPSSNCNAGNAAERSTRGKARKHTGNGNVYMYKLSKVYAHPIHTHTRAHPHSLTHTHTTSAESNFPSTTTTRKKVSSCG